MDISTKQSSRLKKIILSLAFLGAVGTGVWYYVSIPRGPIYEFNEARDTQDILKIFKKNWYWLVSSPDYSPEFALKYRAPNKNPRYLGKLYIKVLRKNDTFIGFCAYYMKTKTNGLFLFLAIKDEFRGKRYGQQLLDYALDDLKRMGAQKITLVTRISNVSGQKLYNRVGFQETSRDEDGYVYFEYIP